MTTTVIVTVSDCGGPVNMYDLYYDYVENGYLLKTNIKSQELIDGYVVDNVPDTATNLIIAGVGPCTGAIYVVPIVPVTPTPTPTSNLDCTFAFTVTRTP